MDKNKGVYLYWKDIVVTTRTHRDILKGVSGFARPGEVVALMGASGAGKTTLLNALLSRNLTGLKVKGQILANGHSIGESITTVSAYVQQEDLFIPTLTVKEHLMIQAMMRMNAGKEERDKKVSEVLHRLMLEATQDCRIGVPGISKGISGGELKRLTFASALLNDPPILFCDEPTTGLDSHMALTLVQIMEDMAVEFNKTIICTIHQPSSDVFELFDQVVLLAQGRVAFHGTPSDAILFFTKCGFHMPDHTNPAEHFIETLAINPTSIEMCKTRCNIICDKFQSSRLGRHLHNQMIKAKQLRLLIPCKRGPLLQVARALMIRNVLTTLRYKVLIKAKLLQKMFNGLFAGFLYMRLELNQSGLMSLRGVLFYYVTEMTYSIIYSVISVMPSDFTVVFREYHDGMYPIVAYYITKVIGFIPLFTFDGLILLVSSYFTIGLAPSFSGFFNALLTLILVEYHVISLGVVIAVICPTYSVATIFAGVFLTAVCITGGIFTNVNTLHPWISWIQYLSWFRFGYENLLINEFSDESRSNFSCWISEEEQATACVRSGKEALEEYGYDDRHYYWNWLFMVLWTLANCCVGYIAMVRRVARER